MPAFEVMTGQSVGTGAQGTVDVDTRRVRKLTVVWRLLATTTPADLTLNDALPFVQPTDSAPVLVPLPATANTAPASDGTNVVAVKQYDVSGVERVRLRAQNNNVGSKSLTVDVFEEIAA